MDDLISRKALIAEYDRVHVGPPGGARKLMEDAPSAKLTITLNDLLDLIDYNRESETEKIQIVGPDDDWNEYDEIRTSSVVLLHLGSAKVNEIEAVGNDVIRVGIDWPTVSSSSKENQP